MRAAGGAGHLDRVAARHDRRRGRAGAGDPVLDPDRRARRSGSRCCGLVDRLHTRMPMPDALRLFADDLDDPSADLIIAALIINSRLRGPGLRDVLGALSRSVREELDMRRKVECGAAVDPAQRADRHWGLGRHGDRARLPRPFVPRAVQLTVRPTGAGPHRLPLRAGDLVAAQAGQVRVAAADAGRHRGVGKMRRQAVCRGRGIMMTEALLIGGLAGLALFLAIFALIPRRVSLAGRIAAFDASSVSPLTERPADRPGNESALTRRLGVALERFCAEQGWQFPSLRANLRADGQVLRVLPRHQGAARRFRPARSALPALRAQPDRPAPVHHRAGLGRPDLRRRLLLPARSGAAAGSGEAPPGLQARDRRVPRPRRDEPVRRPRCARSADVRL